jgi:hypothetical protein
MLRRDAVKAAARGGAAGGIMSEEHVVRAAVSDMAILSLAQPALPVRRLSFAGLVLLSRTRT